MESKISFKNDYSEGAHPDILNLLIKTNLDQEAGYGDDKLSKAAKGFIKKRISNADAEIFFVSGGTQANLLVISHLLKPYESVIAVDSGHIEVHETGAIENTGHKINCIPNTEGKITVAGIQSVLDAHTDNHMVKPAMVYISQSTEIGSIYSKREIEEIAYFCKEHQLKFFIDGARLATALTSSYSDVSIEVIARLADVFYIGGTKNGALLGEAIVFKNSVLAEGFDYYIKQKGALMAKGRILGAQFYALFEDELFFDLGKHANAMSSKLAEAIKQKGYSFASRPVSNQLFPILPLSVIKKLMEKYEFYVWQKLDDSEAVVRIVTSWATEESWVDSFISDLQVEI